MAPRVQRRSWRIARRLFRWCRILVLLLLLGAVIAGIYLNQVGLPDFIKQPLLSELRARGIELQFSRLRLRWYRGIVAEGVRFGGVEQPPGPELTLKEIEVRLNLAALRKGALQVDSLLLNQGRLVWPLAETNQPSANLLVDNIQTELRFLPRDQWELDSFQAHFAGARMQLVGTLTNASFVREWTSRRTYQPTDPRVLQHRLRRLVHTLEQISYSSPPELQLTMRGDARNLDSFNARLVLRAPGAETPWGKFRNGLFSLQLLPLTTTNEFHRVELGLQADDTETQWGTMKNLQLAVHVAYVKETPILVKADLKLLAGQIATKWGAVNEVQFIAQWDQVMTNPVPLSGKSEIKFNGVETSWGKAKAARLNCQLNPPGTHAPPTTDETWAWWAALAPYQLDWETQVDDLQSPKLSVEEIVCQGNWRAPALTVTNLHAQLYQGKLDARAHLNVATRELNVNASSDFEAKKIAPLLTEKGQKWLSQYSWESPPQVNGQLFLVLPAWTNRQPDWRAEVQPTLRLQGEFRGGHCAFRNVSATSARSHFTYSNQVWHLPDLVATRPEGRIELTHIADDRTRDYFFKVHSTIDIQALRPLVEPERQRVFDQIEFTSPPVIDGEISGRWQALEKIAIKAQVACSNFTFRGETATTFQTTLQFTNKFLTLNDATLRREAEQHFAIPGVGIDFAEKVVYLTNGFGVMDPMVVTRAIGPKTARAVEPYRFMKPPAVRVSGMIPIDDIEKVGLHFDVDGGPFQWWRFNISHLTGRVDWVEQTLMLTNIQAAFYEGQAAGWALFDFAPDRGTDFSFDMSTTNSNLHLLMADLSPGTNHLEGTLKGRLNITHANTDDWQSWQGGGKVRLRDGLIWDIPIFGIFSKALNMFWSGLGNSRASDGSATFTITNSLIHSSNLEIRSTGFRMQYDGTVDFKGRVDARMEAELLRDFWGIGRLLSYAFKPLTKLLEYKVTGTLSDPKTEPLYVPKLLLFPLHPLKTLKDLFPDEPAKPPVPAPEPNP